jgi:predicted SAM-dependent methyltransferase
MNLHFNRPLTDYVKVRKAIGALVRNHRFFIDKKCIIGKDYLEIGCGPNTHAGFIHMDYAWRSHIDLCWDVTKGIPLESETLAGVYTEHCLEHLPFAAVDQVLAECYRLLKPGGTIRIIVPDGQIYLSRYVEIMNGRTDVELPYASDDSYKSLYSPIMSVNRIFRSHGHLFIHDFDILRQLLELNQFVDVKRESYGVGRDPKLLIDTASREVESLYVEASKPSTQHV